MGNLWGPQSVPGDTYFAERALDDLQRAHAEYSRDGVRRERHGEPCLAPSDSVPGEMARLERAILRLRPVVLALTQ